ncbi:MAG: HAMP domain-containing sensor histidine kinase [Bacillota bacterium]
MQEKQISLALQGKQISEEFANSYRSGDMTRLSVEMQFVEKYVSARIAVVNNDGIVVLTSPSMDNVKIGNLFAYPSIRQGVLDGSVIVGEALPSDRGFNEKTMVVGYPLEVGDMSGIFMCYSMTEMEAYLYTIYEAVVGVSLIVAVASFILSYLLSRILYKPLIAMNESAKVIANGNYSQRIQVRRGDEFGQLASSFNNLAQSIQDNDKTRRDFIANVSHDLRSPLTSIQGFLTAMLDGTIPPSKQEKYLNIVLDEANRLTRITDSIVDLRFAQSNMISSDMIPFDVNDMMRSVIALMEPQLNGKKIGIKAIYAEKITMVYGDKDKISRVFQNLLNNAIKFSEQNQTIEVETTIVKHEKVMVSITDYGVGIDKEEQKYIFDRFYKADATRGEVRDGSGLGLAIAREFLYAHGEEISVKSQPGVGSTFTFSLKLFD